MTVSSSSIMASQLYANKDVQAQSGASGTWNGTNQSTGIDFSAIAQQFMTTIDTNKDGTLDKAEFSQAAQALAKHSNNSSSVDAAFAKMDANGDGQISSDEMLNAIKQATSETKQKHHHQARSNTTDGISQVAQANTAVQEASPANEMQKVLFNKIMAAYGNSTSTTGTTTNLSA